MNLNHSFRIVSASLALISLAGLFAPNARAGQAHKTKLTASQAEAAALKKYKSGQLQGKTALENEEGKWEYAVMVSVKGKLHEVMVNANTGKIDSEETVTPKEEAAEQKAEAAGKKHGKTGKSGGSAKPAK